MTRQPMASQPGGVPCTALEGIHSAHLTEEQFNALLVQSPDAAAALAEAHLLACDVCAAELAGLRDSLALFRQASSIHAGDQLRRLPQRSLPVRRPALEPAYFAAAAAILLLALLPMQMLHRHSQPPVAAGIATGVQAGSGESDQALLEDVNREISASVPTPMQALADPIDGASDQNSTQRKD